MSPVPDITEAEQWSVETTSKERRPDRKPAIQLAGIAIRMYPRDRELTVHPAIFWGIGVTGLAITRGAGRSRYERRAEFQ